MMKSNIMKRAWEIFRTLVGDYKAKLSTALKRAWAEVKAVAKYINAYVDYNGAELEYVVVGDTYTIKETLKKLGFTWDGNDWTLPLEYEKGKFIPMVNSISNKIEALTKAFDFNKKISNARLREYKENCKK